MQKRIYKILRTQLNGEPILYAYILTYINTYIIMRIITTYICIIILHYLLKKNIDFGLFHILNNFRTQEVFD